MIGRRRAMIGSVIEPMLDDNWFMFDENSEENILIVPINSTKYSYMSMICVGGGGGGGDCRGGTQRGYAGGGSGGIVIKKNIPTEPYSGSNSRFFLFKYPPAGIGDGGSAAGILWLSDGLPNPMIFLHAGGGGAGGGIATSSYTKVIQCSGGGGGFGGGIGGQGGLAESVLKPSTTSSTNKLGGTGGKSDYVPDTLFNKFWAQGGSGCSGYIVSTGAYIISGTAGLMYLYDGVYSIAPVTYGVHYGGGSTHNFLNNYGTLSDGYSQGVSGGGGGFYGGGSSINVRVSSEIYPHNGGYGLPDLFSWLTGRGAKYNISSTSTEGEYGVDPGDEMLSSYIFTKINNNPSDGVTYKNTGSSTGNSMTYTLPPSFAQYFSKGSDETTFVSRGGRSDNTLSPESYGSAGKVWVGFHNEPTTLFDNF